MSKQPVKVKQSLEQFDEIVGEIDRKLNSASRELYGLVGKVVAVDAAWEERLSDEYDRGHRHGFDEAMTYLKDHIQEYLDNPDD